MKYVSIDLETSGLDPQNHNILEFGAVIEDTNDNMPLCELPTYHVYIDNGNITGNAYALSMHPHILKKISENGDNVIKPNELGWSFNRWLMQQGFKGDDHGIIEINVAGKNFGTFDMQFLKNTENFTAYVKINQRLLDPAILCVDWTKDEKLPNLSLCKERNGIMGQVEHTAVEDAKDVIEVLRNFY